MATGAVVLNVVKNLTCDLVILRSAENDKQFAAPGRCYRPLLVRNARRSATRHA